MSCKSDYGRNNTRTATKEETLIGFGLGSSPKGGIDGHTVNEKPTLNKSRVNAEVPKRGIKQRRLGIGGNYVRKKVTV